MGMKTTIGLQLSDCLNLYFLVFTIGYCRRQHVYFLTTQMFYVQKINQLMPSYYFTTLVELRISLSHFLSTFIILDCIFFSYRTSGILISGSANETIGQSDIRTHNSNYQTIGYRIFFLENYRLPCSADLDCCTAHEAYSNLRSYWCLELAGFY
jgi:hypothetical protein